MAHLMGGDGNDIKVGTFVGYNHELGAMENGFERNLEEYAKVFKPDVAYAESLGVTLLYENCPMEGWRSSGYTGTYNNLPGVLAARKLRSEERRVGKECRSVTAQYKYIRNAYSN